MSTHDLMKSAEANDAAWEAARGASLGALKWGVGAAIVGACGYIWSPIYRSTTIQFKVYIQMSGMVLGGMLEADWALREYEHRMRLHRKWQTERAKWARYEEEFIKGNTK